MFSSFCERGGRVRRLQQARLVGGVSPEAKAKAEEDLQYLKSGCCWCRNLNPRMKYHILILPLLVMYLTPGCTPAQDADTCSYWTLVDVERRSSARLVDPDDLTRVEKAESLRLQTTVERQEIITCIRSDSNYRMDVVYKPSNNTPGSPNTASPARMVIDNGFVTSYDESGAIIHQMAFDQSQFQAVVLQSAQYRSGIGRNWQDHIDSIQRLGGTASYPTPSTVVLVYPAVLGGTITETIDLDAGVMRSFEIHRDDGTRRMHIENTFDRDGVKTFLLKSVTMYWETLPLSGVEIVTMTEEIYHRFEY